MLPTFSRFCHEEVGSRFLRKVTTNYETAEDNNFHTHRQDNLKHFPRVYMKIRV
jgi:hypothetical protein